MKRVCAFEIELGFGRVGFEGGRGRGTGVPGEIPLGARETTNNKFNPHGVKRVPGSNLIFKLCEPSSSPGKVIFRLKSFYNKQTNKKMFRKI